MTNMKYFMSVFICVSALIGAAGEYADGSISDNSIHGVDHGKTASWLGEAFLSYKKNNTLINFGRQNLKSPLINSDDWAVFPNNFEAILLQNSDLPDTTVAIYYVTEERKLKSDTFNDISED